MVGLLLVASLVWVATLPPPLPVWERDALANRARELIGKNDPIAAADAYRKVVEVDPTPANFMGLARALLQGGRPAEALVALGSIGETTDTGEAAWLKGRALLQAGEIPAARAVMTATAAYRASHPIEPEPSVYVGSERCAGCHKGNHQSQQASAHARTFARVQDLGKLPLPDAASLDEFDPEVSHALVREGESIRQETKTGSDLFQAVIIYAFGSGDRGLTLVGKDSSGADRELRLSRYAEPHGWQVTSGQTGKPGTKADFLGRPLSENDLRGCFGCHTTQPDAALANTGPTAKDRSIGCEQCHGPGGNHLLAVEAKLPEMAIARAHHGPGGGAPELCARCHSPRESSAKGADPAENVLARATNDEVRFQSITLPKSRCATESKGALDCLTCHDPHHDAEKEPAFYEAKCLACHQAGRMGTRTVCPVNPAKDCVGCHMPAVRAAVPHSTFTDHQIRVHRKSEVPPLLRQPD